MCRCTIVYMDMMCIYRVHMQYMIMRLYTVYNDYITARGRCLCINLVISPGVYILGREKYSINSHKAKHTVELVCCTAVYQPVFTEGFKQSVSRTHNGNSLLIYLSPLFTCNLTIIFDSLGLLVKIYLN